MTISRSTVRLLFALCVAWLFTTSQAYAQLDRVYSTKGGPPVSGAITETSSQGVQLKKGGATQDFAAGEISKIMFEGDPASLTKGRELALDGQYDQAIAELKKIDPTKLKRDVVKADANYYLVYSEAQLALQGQGDKAAAVGKAMAFARGSSDSWHFFSVAKLLGDLALGLKNYDQAMKFYGSLASSSSTDTKIESVYLTGLVQLKKGESAAAAADFEKLIGMTPQTPKASRLQTLAKAGKAVAMARDGKGSEGLEVVKGLIAELNPTDVEMASRIYNAQGASYEASGDKEGAIMAYLHTQLMFSSQPDAHAEALSKLVELWPQVGKPERAAEARQELKQRYPGF